MLFRSNRAMSTIAKEHHGQIPPTRLTTGILEVTGFASVPALFEAVTRGHRVNLVDVVPVVLDAADDGDDAAVALVQQVASTHARDVLGVARVLGMLDESCDVVLAGSVHARRCRPWSEAFTSTLTEAMPGAVPRLLEGPPVTGAVLLAIEALGNDANEVAVKVRDGATTMLAAQVAVP